MVSHAVWKTWPSGLSNDKNLGLRVPRAMFFTRHGRPWSNPTIEHNRKEDIVKPYQLIEAEWPVYASPTYAIIGSDNGLSLDRRQAIIWTNAVLLSIELLETNFSQVVLKIQTFLFRKIHLKMSSTKFRPFCLGLMVLNKQSRTLFIFNGV